MDPIIKCTNQFGWEQTDSIYLLIQSLSTVFVLFWFAQDGGGKKGDPMDLRLDIEWRKKYSSHERDYNQNRGRDKGDSPDSSTERSVENLSKCRKKSKYVWLPYVLYFLRLSAITLNNNS